MNNLLQREETPRKLKSRKCSLSGKEFCSVFPSGIVSVLVLAYEKKVVYPIGLFVEKYLF